ncbi:MAG: ABC transporter substrate-binding protein [Spirochaetia bacterium]|jgi:peptide/nickel transport system substrate-binding protein|nr:ABC transporter substrate-binding protein [Spirochaetia bacterium]
MKKVLTALAISLCVVVASTAQVKNGPIVDKVIYTVSMDQSLAMKDIVAGKADVFFQAVPANILRTLNEADKAKLDIYAVPSGSWSLMLNPIPNKAPYTWTKSDGVTEFNPFAIQEVRFALNWLINRKKLIDEILLGDGDPAFTMATPGQPGTYRYNLIASKLGMTPTGNERKAISDIDKAMTAASMLPENKGKLVKKGAFWQYDGKDVTIKFLIRVDDPNGRLPAGRYIADQIEKAGIKVDRQERDRSGISIAYGSNPADLKFHMYTEGWGAGATRAWWDVTVSQMYAPYYGYMAGGADPANWNYEQKRIDELGQKGMNGQFLTEADYWSGNLEAVELGVKDSCRIYLATQLDKFVANKARFNSRMAYGLGDGLNGWSIRTADVKPDASGQKVLRVIQFSARGSLFMSAWDPVGVDGFSDVYSASIVEPCSDSATFESPNNAADTPLRTKYDVKKAQTAPKILADDSLGGDLPVPATAVLYDSASKTWKAVGSGKTTAVIATGSLIGGKWHNGEAISEADVRYAYAFPVEWSTKDGEGDKFYDETYAAQYAPALIPNQGFVFNKDGSITSYVNYFFAPEMNRTVATVAAVGVKAGNPGRQTVVSWEVYEALALLVAEGAKSGTVYTFTQSDAITEVDVVAPKCVADIKAKLQDMVAKNHLPASLKGIITPAQAVQRYKATLAFIDKYGHAYVSNGPFVIAKIDTNTNSVTLDAFRDYPYKSDYWPKYFRQQITQIENVKAPTTPTKKVDAVFEISASSFIYPDTAYTPLTNKAKVDIRLQLLDGTEKVYAAKYSKPGLFIATIPVKDLAVLKSGQSYTVVVTSSLSTEAPSVVPTSLVLF